MPLFLCPFLVLIHYEGRLVDGTNLVNGTVELELSLYNSASNGTSLSPRERTVAVPYALYARDARSLDGEEGEEVYLCSTGGSCSR